MGNEKCHVSLFDDYTASIYLNVMCMHKHIRLFILLGTQDNQAMVILFL